VNTSLYAHPKHPCFVRSWEERPAPGELCKPDRDVVSIDKGLFFRF